MSPAVALTIVGGLWVLASSLDYQDLVNSRRIACEAKGPGWTVEPKSMACIKPPRPECEPARRHTPSNPQATAKSKESCNAPR